MLRHDPHNPQVRDDDCLDDFLECRVALDDVRRPRALGQAVLANVPRNVGVYQFIDARGKVLYVGKANDLKRRLLQYLRSARSRKKGDRKARRIMHASAEFRLRSCADECSALLLENRLIQQLRPRFNLDGKFSYRYPAFAVGESEDKLCVIMSSHQSLVGDGEPGVHPNLQAITSLPVTKLRWFGCFRSRVLCGEAFQGIATVLGRLGHRDRGALARALARLDYTNAMLLRQVDPQFKDSLLDLLDGESDRFLRLACHALLEIGSARREAQQIQEGLQALKELFEWEARPLNLAKAATGHIGFLRQQDRDALLIRFRNAIQ